MYGSATDTDGIRIEHRSTPGCPEVSSVELEGGKRIYRIVGGSRDAAARVLAALAQEDAKRR